jgi:hypothetical protein
MTRQSGLLKKQKNKKYNNISVLYSSGFAGESMSRERQGKMKIDPAIPVTQKWLKKFWDQP